MFISRNDNKYTRNYSFPATKLRNVFCTHCKHQFFLQEFVPLRGLVPLLLECGHVICDKCAKLSIHDPCPLCNTISQSVNDQKISLPLNIYALGLMVMSHNRPVDEDDCDISFSKSTNSKVKQQSIQGLCHECGIQAAIKCPQCVALYCFLCYSKIHGKALQSHSKIMLADGTNHSHSFIIKNTCSEQCTESLGYYCENCETAGCSHCMLQLHKKHNYKSLLEKNQDLLPEFYKVSQCVTENLQRIHQTQKKLSRIAMYPKETHNIDSVETAVTQHFAHLHGILQNVERKIIDSLNDHRNARSKNVDDIFQQLKAYESQLQSAILITASVAENLDKIDIQEVIQKLKKLVSIPCHLMLSSMPDDQDVKFNVNTNIVDVIKEHYTVEIPPTSSYDLRRTDSLPDNYQLEPLTEELNISILKRPSPVTNKPTSVISMAPKKCDDLPVIGSSEMIRVSHVVDPSCFYVQMIQNQGRIAELEKGLASLAATTGVMPTSITINTLYIVQCLEDKAWHRARVIDKKISNGDEKYTVFYIDYGMKEDNVPLGKIRNIVPQYAMLPMMAIRCCLYDIVPNSGKWHPDAIEAFKQLACSNAMVSMSVSQITGDTYYVDLSVVSSKDWHLASVKDSLTYMKFATCVSPTKLMRTNPDSTKVYYKEQLEMEIYTHVEVLFVESPNCIYVRKTQANRSYYNKLISDMAESYGQSLSCNDLIPVLSKDLPCAARAADGAWHRGIIKEVTENTISVFYVDLGYTLILNYDAVRALPKKYMSCKTQAIKVSLKSIKPRHDKEQWGQDTIDYLRRLLMDLKVVRVIAFDKSEDTYTVAMFTLERKNITHILLENDLVLQTFSPHAKFDNKKKRNKSNRDVVTGLEKKSKNIKKQPVEKTIETAIEKSIETMNEVPNTSVKNKSIEENEDPFKVSVQIHQVQSPDCIYVSNPTQDQTDTENMMSKMQEFYRKYRSAKRDVWNENAVCAVYLSQNETYYRGRVIEVKSADKVVVFLYDLGVEETVTMNDLQSLFPLFFETPTHVFKIKLSGILPCGGSSFWPSLSCEKLHEIVNNNHNCKFYISKLEIEDTDNAAIPVELWIKQLKMDGPLAPTRYEISSINRMLVEHGVALPIKEYAKKRDKILAVELKKMLQKKLERLAKCEPNVQWFEIKKKLNNSGEINMNKNTSKASNNSDSDSEFIDSNVYDNIPSLPKLSAWLPAEPIFADSFIAIPTYLDHEGFLYLHSKEQNADTLRSIEMKLEKYNDFPLESCDTVWVAGDLCIAQYHSNKKWYRGKVVNVLENDMISVEFVDYGNVEECSIGTVKKRVILEDVPIQCTKCAIHGLIPGRATGRWLTEELDRIHGLLIEQKCEVTVLDRTKTHLIISLTILPNKYCRKEINLLTFLVNEWQMDLKPTMDMSVSDTSVSTDSPDVIIEDSKSFFVDSDLLKETIISGNSILLPNTITTNKNDSSGTTDTENLFWSEVKNEAISSTPQVVSEENLLMNYEPFDVPNDTEFIEVELCYSLSTTEFYAHVKENAQSKIINDYYNQYKLVMKDLQENAWKQQPITNFAPNTPCCAKYSDDDTWYRSIIIESEPAENSDSTEVKLLYVDYGNCDIRIVNSEQRELFALKKEWMDVPLMVIKCKLWNIEVVPEANIEDFLTELDKMYNRDVIAAIKETSSDFIYIELYDDEERKELSYNALIEKGLFQFVTREN